MGNVYEITVWRPHRGKQAELLAAINQLKELFLYEGVSNVEILTGHVGKDVGNLIMIQTFKSLTDNGSVNDAIDESERFKTLRESNGFDLPADLVSHDLYRSIS
jgi:hypothetical protein